MTMRLQGPSGVVIEVDELQGRGLVAGGHAKDLDAEEVKVEVPARTEFVVLPAGNAPRQEVVDFALAHGKTEDDIEGKTVPEIRALFTESDDKTEE